MRLHVGSVTVGVLCEWFFKSAQIHCFVMLQSPLDQLSSGYQPEGHRSSTQRGQTNLRGCKIINETKNKNKQDCPSHFLNFFIWSSPLLFPVKYCMVLPLLTSNSHSNEAISELIEQVFIMLINSLAES